MLMNREEVVEVALKVKVGGRVEERLADEKFLRLEFCTL